jgi:protein arginine kinase
VMVNEEDHIRLQSLAEGLAFEAAWKRADEIDTQLGERLPFAFDSEWGFCTRCPTNAGTGMRASCLLHLPALVINGDIEKILESLVAAGVTARGFYGERSKAFGDLFQISNSVSLGQSEREILESVQRAVEALAHHERQARAALLEPSRRAATEDLVFRAWGILRNARLISYDEAMLLLSRVRVGSQIGLALPVDPAVLNHLMLLTQPAHLQILSGRPLKTEERDHLRAELIRDKLGKDSYV